MKNILRNITKKSYINEANSVTYDIANIRCTTLARKNIELCGTPCFRSSCNSFYVVIHFMYRYCEFDPFYLIVFLTKSYKTHKIIHLVSLNPLWNFQYQSIVRLNLLELKKLSKLFIKFSISRFCRDMYRDLCIGLTKKN